jgi:hypothetical protein
VPPMLVVPLLLLQMSLLSKRYPIIITRTTAMVRTKRPQGPLHTGGGADG